jgi:hypothetical protein
MKTLCELASEKLPHDILKRIFYTGSKTREQLRIITACKKIQRLYISNILPPDIDEVIFISNKQIKYLYIRKIMYEYSLEQVISYPYFAIEKLGLVQNIPILTKKSQVRLWLIQNFTLHQLSYVGI